MRYMLAGLIAVVIFTKIDVAADAPDESKYKQMPWHLVDTWWDLGKDSAFESYSVDVTISDDVPGDVNLYISPLGLAHLSGSAFYGGIQTRCDGNTKSDPKLRELGPGFLMSMWGERSLDAIRTSEGGFCQSSGHEGDFVSVRRPYAWKKGSYRYRVARMDRELVDGKPCTWVGALIENRESGENVFIGALRFKGENLVLDRHVANFIEIYGQRRPTANIPKLSVTFGNLRINGEPAESPTARAVYPKGVPDFADVKAKDNSLVVTIGQPLERTVREVKLIEPKQNSK